MVSPEVQRILDDKPFAGKIAIKDLQSLAGEHALSGKAYFVIEQDDKIRYKVRVCVSEERARHLERNIQRFQKFFPAFHGRDRNYILTEALQGYRNLAKEELLANARKIGRMCAEIHQVQEAGGHDPHAYFYKRLNWLRTNNSIDDALYLQAAAKYEENIKKLDIRASLDLADIHEGNIMMNK